MKSFIYLNEDTFDEVISKDKYSFVYFWTEWNSKCKKLNGVLEKVKLRFPDVDFYSINIDECPNIKNRYDISYVPLIVIFNRGELLIKEYGEKSLASYESIIRHLIK